MIVNRQDPSQATQTIKQRLWLWVTWLVLHPADTGRSCRRVVPSASWTVLLNLTIKENLGCNFERKTRRFHAA